MENNYIECPYCIKQIKNNKTTFKYHSKTKRHLENFNFYKKYNIKIKIK